MEIDRRMYCRVQQTDESMACAGRAEWLLVMGRSTGDKMNTQANNAYHNAQSILKNNGVTEYRFHRTWSDLGLLEYTLLQSKVRMYEGLASIAESQGTEVRDEIEEELCKIFAHVLIEAMPRRARKYAAEILGEQDAH